MDKLLKKLIALEDQETEAVCVVFDTKKCMVDSLTDLLTFLKNNMQLLKGNIDTAELFHLVKVSEKAVNAEGKAFSKFSKVFFRMMKAVDAICTKEGGV